MVPAIKKWSFSPFTFQNHRLFTGYEETISIGHALHADTFPANAEEEKHDAGKDGVRNVLFIGDSMTGWLSERLNAYGRLNGFDVSTIVWDGSTINKSGPNSTKLQKNILLQEPDAIFVSLGMNELFEQHPETRLNTAVDKILDAAGDIPVIWVGPPSWPGHNKGKCSTTGLPTSWEKHFFRSFDLGLPRQGPKTRIRGPRRHGEVDGFSGGMDRRREHYTAPDC